MNDVVVRAVHLLLQPAQDAADRQRQDQVDDRDAQIATLADDIEKGEAGYIKDYLQEIVDQKEGTPENIEDAKELIEKLDDFKPLAKIEEQLEENYNHIDGSEEDANNIIENIKKLFMGTPAIF